MSADIFISFASKDAKIALTICQAIESRGFKCWISARDIEPGENFQIAIVQALRRAKILLLVFTANSNTSEEMNKELALASQQKMMVIPLRAEDVAPNDAFAYEFATRQWIDAFADWEASIEQLCRRIDHALAAIAKGEEERAAIAQAKKDEQAAASAAAEDAEPPPAQLRRQRAGELREARAVRTTAAAAPVTDSDDEELRAPGSLLKRAAVIAVFVALAAAIAFAVTPMLTRGKPAPAKVASTVPAEAPLPPPAAPTVTLLETSEPAATNGVTQTNDTEAVAPEAPPVVAKPKPAAPRKPKAAATPRPAQPTVDIPY